jgi:alkylation response protein AidB-like acyl-CoA dehydrogenase
VEEAKKEADEYFAAYVWYPQRTGRVDLLVPRAQETGTAQDPIVRQKVAQVLSMHRIAGWTAARAAAAQKLGRPPGPEGSISKLTASHIARGAAEAHALMTGAAGMLYGDTVTEILVSVPAMAIAGGTSEVQKNIIGERVLGLPKEPQVDRDLPFRDVPRNVR